MTDPPDGTWKKSTYCASNSCVEFAVLGGQVALRDSKHADGSLLMFSPTEWVAFLKGARNGEFNPTSTGLKT